MFICLVTGNVVSPIKNDTLAPAKLLVVQRALLNGSVEESVDMLALDPGHGAGVGDYVLVAREGAVVKQLMASDSVPANVIILGVVDDWSPAF